MIRHPQVNVYHLKHQTLKHVEIIKFLINVQIIRLWKGLDLEIRVLIITINRQPQVKPYHHKPQDLKHVKIMKASDKVTYDTSLERP